MQDASNSSGVEYLRYVGHLVKHAICAYCVFEPLVLLSYTLTADNHCMCPLAAILLNCMLHWQRSVYCILRSVLLLSHALMADDHYIWPLAAILPNCMLYWLCWPSVRGTGNQWIKSVMKKW